MRQDAIRFAGLFSNDSRRLFHDATSFHGLPVNHPTDLADTTLVNNNMFSRTSNPIDCFCVDVCTYGIMICLLPDEDPLMTDFVSTVKFFFYGFEQESAERTSNSQFSEKAKLVLLQTSGNVCDSDCGYIPKEALSRNDLVAALLKPCIWSTSRFEANQGACRRTLLSKIMNQLGHPCQVCHT